MRLSNYYKAQTCIQVANTLMVHKPWNNIDDVFYGTVASKVFDLSYKRSTGDLMRLKFLDLAILTLISGKRTLLLISTKIIFWSSRGMH